jgi:rhamnosyltransferase subunit B
VRPRRVLFATIGSLGDLHPLFAVGNGLLARGHAVALATSAEHRERVEAAGLEWRHMRPDLPPGEEPAALFAKVFDPREGPEFTFRRVVAPAIRDSHADLERAARDADLLVSTTAAFAAPLVAARRPDLAWASAALQPLAFFSARDPPVLSQAPRLTALLHGLGPLLGLPMRATGRAVTRPWSAPVRALRRDLGLPTPGPDPLWEGQHARALVLAMFSPLLARRQADWPAQARVTGFPFWGRADAGRPAPDGLDAFLAAGPPPVVFTLGSAVVLAARSFYAESLAAARALGRARED